MTREALQAALSSWDSNGYKPSSELGTIIAAARKQLALMAEFVDDPECGDCDHLPRKVYPQETVEKIAEALRQVTLGNINASLTENRYPLIAVAVLDALGETE